MLKGRWYLRYLFTSSPSEWHVTSAASQWPQRSCAIPRNRRAWCISTFLSFLFLAEGTVTPTLLTAMHVEMCVIPCMTLSIGSRLLSSTTTHEWQMGQSKLQIKDTHGMLDSFVTRPLPWQTSFLQPESQGLQLSPYIGTPHHLKGPSPFLIGVSHSCRDSGAILPHFFIHNFTKC